MRQQKQAEIAAMSSEELLAAVKAGQLALKPQHPPGAEGAQARPGGVGGRPQNRTQADRGAITPEQRTAFQAKRQESQALLKSMSPDQLKKLAEEGSLVPVPPTRQNQPNAAVGGMPPFPLA